MILGDTCTRACAFCNVKTGKPNFVDHGEAIRIAESVKQLDLEHVVITSVDRDDLIDGGAMHFINVIDSIKSLKTVEVFGANSDGLIITVFPAAIAPISGVKDNWKG